MTEAEQARYVDALERIAGPVDRPFLGHDGRLAVKALGREPASAEAIERRAERDFKHWRDGIPLLSPAGKGDRDPRRTFPR